MHEIESARVLIPLLAPAVTAVLIMASGRWPNVRESWSVAGAVVTFLGVLGLMPHVTAGGVWGLPLFELIPGAAEAWHPPAQRVGDLQEAAEGGQQEDPVLGPGDEVAHGSAEGKPLRMIGVHTDVSARKESEEQLLKAQEMLEHVLDSVPQAVFWKDRRSVYLGCNHSFARAVGHEHPASVVGTTDYDLTPGRADAYHSDDREVMESKTPKRHILEFVTHPDGRELWVDTTKVPLVDNRGDVYGVLGVYDDITERKRFEEVLKESQERAQRLASAAFEGLGFSEGGRITNVNEALTGLLQALKARGRTQGAGIVAGRLDAAWPGRHSPERLQDCRDHCSDGHGGDAENTSARPFERLTVIQTPAGPGSMAPQLAASSDGRVFLSWLERGREGTTRCASPRDRETHGTPCPTSSGARTSSPTGRTCRRSSLLATEGSSLTGWRRREPRPSPTESA